MKLDVTSCVVTKATEVTFVFLGGSSLSRAAYRAYVQCFINGLQDSQHFPSPGTTGSAVSALHYCHHCDSCSIAKRVFRVRAARRRGKAKASVFTQPRTSPERTYEIFGHPSWPKEVSPRAHAHCLRPQAEFARASVRGLRRVKNFVQDAKGMCKKFKEQTAEKKKLRELS